MDLFRFPRPKTFAEASQLVQERQKPLEELVTRAYRDQAGEDWKSFQLGMFHFHTQYPGPWQEDWASHGLRTLAYDFEDKVLPGRDLPPEAGTIDGFIDYACKLLPSITTLQTPLLRFLIDKEPSRDQWRTYAASMYGRGRVHHGNLARLSLNLPREEYACFAYRMLGDEGGQGNYKKAHSTLILPFLEHLGGSIADTDRLGEIFEGKVLFNWMNRCFMHPNPVWGVATIFYLENQAAMEFTAMLPRLRKAKFPEEVLEFFTIHGDDPETELHNNMCRDMLRSHIKGPQDIKIANVAIRRAGDLFESLFARVAQLMEIKAA